MQRFQQKRRMRSRKVVAAVMVGVVLFSMHVAVAQAQSGNASNAASTNARGTGRLETVRLRACQNREAALNRIMLRMANRAEAQLGVFSTISQRVQAFYADKGRTIATYNTLVADVNAKKAAAEVQAASLKGNTTIACAGDDPKGMAFAFQEQLRVTTTALKVYRTAVKNLIVGVKSAQGQAASNGNANSTNVNTQ